MNVGTKRVKRLVRNPSTVYPGGPNDDRGRCVVLSDCEPELAVVCAGDPNTGEPVTVITVLWRGQDYVRPDAMESDR
jgi:hypothetical protein